MVTNGLARQKGVLADGEYEKKKREAERAEQWRQLLAIQEELKRVRGEKSASVQNAEATGGGM